MSTESQRVASKKWRHSKVSWMSKIKERSGCFRCDETDPIVLEFHHLKEKIYNRRRDRKGRGLEWHRLPWNQIASEINKCIILCANCHRREEAFLRD